jgi:hypothetical protein
MNPIWERNALIGNLLFFFWERRIKWIENWTKFYSQS